MKIVTVMFSLQNILLDCLAMDACIKTNKTIIDH